MASFYTALEHGPLFGIRIVRRWPAHSLPSVIADLDSAGPQTALVRRELAGVTVPGQVVISNDGGTAAPTRVGALVALRFIIDVGDQPLAHGTVTLISDTNVTLMTSATVTLPALPAGSTFSRQLAVSYDRHRIQFSVGTGARISTLMLSITPYCES